MTQQAPIHLLEGATLGTEDRGDIVIRNAAGDLLYRFVPTAKVQSQSLAEVLRVSQANAEHFARRDGLSIPDSPVAQVKKLLLDFKSTVNRLWEGFDQHRDDEARLLHVALEDAKDHVKRIEPVLTALDLPPK